MDPLNPQAYANVANFFHNIQRFEEAMEMWKEAKDHTEDEDMQAYLESRRRLSQYGLYSIQRDRAYEGGQVCVCVCVRKSV